MSQEFDEDEIQRNLEKFMEQQIKEYKYIQASKMQDAKPEPPKMMPPKQFNDLELNVPNLNAPKPGRKTAGVSYIDVSRDSYEHRNYDDDFDDDFDEEPVSSFRNYEDDFDDDFEVTYQEEEPVRRQPAAGPISYVPVRGRDEDDDIFDEDDYEYDNEEFERRKADRKARRNKKAEKHKKGGDDGGDDENPPTGKKKKKLTKGKLALRIIIPIVALVAVIFGLWYFLVGAAYDKMTYKEAPKYTDYALEEDGITNILLLGNDSRLASGDGRSDVMMLMTINKPQNKIYLTSFLRDLKVNIPGYGYDRMGHAYAKGGPEMVMRVLSETFDIKISRYMLVNFQAFANVGDAVGGIDMEVSAKEVDWINAYLWEYNEINGDDMYKDNLPDGTHGNIHLNGPQALAYCRNRKIGDDFERTNRQKKTISAIVKKMPLAMLTNMGGVMDGLFPNLTTSLTKDDCYKLSTLILKIKGMEIVQSSVPLDNAYTPEKYNGMQLLKPDIPKNKEYLHNTVMAKTAPAQE